MFNVEEILARLNNGENANDIADEMVNVLNEANNRYIQEQKEKESKEEKITELNYILTCIEDFVNKYYCETDEDHKIVSEAFDELTAEKVITMIEEAGAAVLAYNKIFGDIDKIFNSAPKARKACSCGPKDKEDADFVIKSFLKSIGL